MSRTTAARLAAALAIMATAAGCQTSGGLLLDAPARELTDAQMGAISTMPLGRAMRSRDTLIRLGRHHGYPVVADYVCGEECNARVLPIIHYVMDDMAECARVGGVETSVDWPEAPSATYCVPGAIAGNSTSGRPVGPFDV